MRLLPPDVLITLALGIAIVGVIISAVLFVCIAIVRYRRRKHTEAQRRFVAEWKEILRSSDTTAPADELPPISPQDRFLFLRLWCQAYEDVLASLTAPEDSDPDASSAFRYLKGISDDTALLSTAVSLAQSGTFHQKLVAVKCTGYLKDTSALPVLDELLTDENAYLSLHAFQAMVRIDRKYAIYQRPGAVRPDWPDEAYQHIIREAHARQGESRLPDAGPSEANVQAPRAHAPQSWAEVLSRMKRRVT